jgi:pimeloyl-ACP methyl ester carboxylesterase
LPGISAFWSIVSRVHFDTVRRVHASDVPVWVAHGDKDFVIPVSMGREVFAAARRKGELLIIPHAGHNDVPEVGGETYWSWLARALAPASIAATTDARAETRAVP